MTQIIFHSNTSAIHMYPRCREWLVPDRAAPLLYGMKSVVLRVGELGVSLVPSAQTVSHMHASPHTNRQVKAPHGSVFEHLQEQRGEQLVGTLHFHVEEARGVAGTDHAQVRHLH